MPAANDKSLGELFADLSRETATLVRKEVELARTEMTAKASRFTRQAAYVAVGGRRPLCRRPRAGGSRRDRPRGRGSHLVGVRAHRRDRRRSRRLPVRAARPLRAAARQPGTDRNHRNDQGERGMGEGPKDMSDDATRDPRSAERGPRRPDRRRRDRAAAGWPRSAGSAEAVGYAGGLAPAVPRCRRRRRFRPGRARRRHGRDPRRHRADAGQHQRHGGRHPAEAVAVQHGVAGGRHRPRRDPRSHAPDRGRGRRHRHPRGRYHPRRSRTAPSTSRARTRGRRRRQWPASAPSPGG